MKILFWAFSLTLVFSFSKASEWLYYKHYPWVYDAKTEGWLYLTGAGNGQIYAYRNNTNTWEVFEGTSGLQELFTIPLLDFDGKQVPTNVLKGKIIGIYFSAHWSPPCRMFTPKLVKFRDENKRNFEVVFISSDRSPEAQMNYMKETNMKWYTLPHRSDAANALTKKFEVIGVPSLIIVTEDGKIITKNGRGDVTSDPEGALKSWQNSND